MELNDTELNRINFGDKTDSDNASNDSDEYFAAKKPISFWTVSNSLNFWEFINQMYSALKTHFVFPNVKFLCCFLTETFALHLRDFNIAEIVNIVGIAFLHKCKYSQIFQF